LLKNYCFNFYKQSATLNETNCLGADFSAAGIIMLIYCSLYICSFLKTPKQNAEQTY